MSYALMAVVVFGTNLLPAFGPPTWSVLAFYGLKGHLHPVALVGLGAIAAAAGRLVLALACRALRSRLPQRRVAHLSAARDLLTGSPRRSMVGLVLFALSPVPSAQLFEAAGLMGLPLPRLVAVFFAGRLVSYSMYVGGATALRGAGLGTVLSGSVTGPWGIAIQVALLAGVVALARVNWTSLMARHRPHAASAWGSAEVGRKSTGRRWKSSEPRT